MIDPPDIDKALRRLEILKDKRRELKNELDALVLILRSPGLDGSCDASWSDIGDALGVSRQAAQQHYDKYL